MLNIVAATKPLINFIMKVLGLKTHLVEIKPGTIINFWVPSKTLKNDENSYTKPNKPVVVLLHGFAGDGILTWMFQVVSLAKHYSVYVPDLLFFGNSFSDSSDRSMEFQAECLMKGLKKLGVERCSVVGFSYGGMVGFKMAEHYPDLVEALVVTGALFAITDSIGEATLKRLGFGSYSELLMPTSVKGTKKLLSAGFHMKVWFPNKFFKDFLEVMFNNRKQRSELLEGMIAKNTTVPVLKQKIHLLWGEKDQIHEFEVAKNMKEQLGDMATYRGIENAGHLVHLERPCVYNKFLNKFLSSIHDSPAINRVVNNIDH